MSEAGEEKILLRSTVFSAIPALATWGPLAPENGDFVLLPGNGRSWETHTQQA